MGIRLWLDDKRPMPNGFDVWSKNAYDANNYIMFGNVDYISFDHDLGYINGKDDPNNTGYAVAKFIEQLAANGIQNKAIGWDVHSDNPVGRQRINWAMKSAEKIWNERKME